MKCKKCSGTGRITVGWNTFPCEVCKGTGEIKMTNEEYLKSCTPEQLAEWVAKQCGNAVMESTYDVSKLRKKRYWVEWLKQPHTNE